MSYKSYKSLGIDKNKPSPESMGNVFEISNKIERDSILQQNSIVIIDNYTTWCNPCNKITPYFAQLAQTYSGKCFLAKEDVDKNILGKPNILGVPCFHFYINGTFIPDMTVTGADIEKVRETIENIIS